MDRHARAGNVSSSDGQHFLTAGQAEAWVPTTPATGTALGAHLHPRLSPARALQRRGHPPAGESAYVVEPRGSPDIDGLFHHEADLSTLTHHTDGGGVSDHNLALTALPGVRFAPRIPNIADRKLYAFGPASTWPARPGRLRDRAAAMLQHKASALALVTGAIALRNTVYLGRALDALRARGESIPDALLVHLAPSGWQHINLASDYLRDADGSLGPDGFRPLRGLETPSRAVAA